MSRSKLLFKLQQIDSELDKSLARIQEIKEILLERNELDLALAELEKHKLIFDEKLKLLKQAENNVQDQSFKLTQNEQKLYSGMVKNPKELEDLQQEAVALKKFLGILEDRQLEAMIEMENAQDQYSKTKDVADQADSQLNSRNKLLTEEDQVLNQNIEELKQERTQFLENNIIPDLEDYRSLRKTLHGIAVTLMVSESCASCGANIPSAVAQEARSPTHLANCPSCKRILHPE
jgi:predicted  nucleic acid-binding Zn-ribbon protein